MKKESIDKLSALYVNLVHEGKEELAEMITEVLRAEPNDAKLGKLNLYDFADKNMTRPALCGVYHDEGNRVASDGFMMIAVKEPYDPEMEGKVVYKDGSVAPEGTCYPRWRTVIPKEEGYRKFTINKEEFLDWLKDVRAEHKAIYGKGVRFSGDWFVGIGGTYFKAEFFFKFLTAMDYLGTDEISVRDSRAAYAQTDKGVVLIMPKMCAEFSEYQKVLELAD